MLFLFRATIAREITTRSSEISAVVKVKRNGVKLKKRATIAVTAKLNPMEKVRRSISSMEFF